jgi:putative protein kinase ArgK-like GTPase of G3E family
MSLHLTEAKWDVCAYDVVAIESEFGIKKLVRSVREIWKKQEKGNFGHEQDYQKGKTI